MAKKNGQGLVSPADRKILKQVGNRVREARERKKLSVYELTGEDMPIKSRQHWQAIENGQKNINITTTFKLARTLELKIEDLVKGID